MEKLVKIWNKTNYTFDQSHCREILNFLKCRGYRDNKCTSGREQAGEEEEEESKDERRATEGREDDGDSDMPTMDVRREVERAKGKMRREKAVDEDNTLGEEEEEEDGDDQEADIGASLDGGLMAGGRRGQEGAARAMMEPRGSKKRKRKAKTTATTTPATPPLPKKCKVLRQTSMVEAFNPVRQRDFSNYLQWYYVSGIPFEASRRPEYNRMRKHLLECPPYTQPALPTHRVISGDDILEQQRVVADLVAAVRKDIAATGATILTDGGKSIMSDQIDGSNGKVGKREDIIIRARAVVRFIREHGAALNLYRRYSAAHPSSASAAAASSSAAPPQAQRRGRELVYPAPTWFATHYLMLERLLDRSRALEALMMSDDWLRTAWRRSIFLQARWVRHHVCYAPFWEHVEDIVELMTPVMQLLRRLDRGGRVMTPMWSWALAMVDRVARARLNRTWKDELHIVIQACQARVDHMLESTHCISHLLNLRHRSIMFFGAARYNVHDKTLAEDSLRYLRQQTGDNEDVYQTWRTQLAEFHSREGNWTYEGVEVLEGVKGRGLLQRGEGDVAGRAVVAAASAEVAASPAEFAAASPEVAVGFAEVAAEDAEAVAASVEVAVGSAEVGGEAAEVGRASTQFGPSFNDDMFGASLGLPPTPTGERDTGGVDAQATRISQILRGLPSCSVGDISSSMLWQVAEDTQGSSEQREHVVGDDGECRPVQERVLESEQDRTDREERERALELARHCEMTQSIAAKARAERMLKTDDGAGHCPMEDAKVECGGVVGGDASERHASPIHGVCILPFAGAMSVGELEWQALEDPLRADRRGRMDEASKWVMAEGPTFVSCSPSVPSSTINVILPTHAEGPGTTPSPASAPTGESPPPKSRKKKMRIMSAGKSLSTVRRVTHQMRASQPGLAGLHPRTLEALGGDIVADTAAWRDRASTQGTARPMSTPAEAAVPRAGRRTSTTATKEHDEHSCPPGRSMAGRILGEDVRALTTQRSSQTPISWESGTDGVEMPADQRARVSVYDLLRARGEDEAAPQGGIHAMDTTHGPVGGTGGGDGTTSVGPQRRRKDIVDDNWNDA
ncbi:hypothetical protein CBR_g51432 [Chara braunii]|uniref:Uncharacterized protein n=1 Tax=Chara braunii TaxID=69332 RepID=A0A388K691_CHABU|nr:hypothetical protein CBR_g51432 [Chara braunii]|eukprot:GBG65549.1 hypothetical protein CBR_g51432 [Chara braunii]